MGDVDYIIKTPNRRKSRQLYDINMLKEYKERRDNGNFKTSLLCFSGTRRC